MHSMMHDGDIQIYSRNLILDKKKSIQHPFVGSSRRAAYNVLDLKITKKKGKWKGSTSKKPLDVVVVLVI